MTDQKLDVDFADAQPLRKSRSRRSTFELRMDILTVVRDGAEGPTQIMVKANLSWKLVTQHLKALVDREILSMQSVKNRCVYRLTDKGITILRSYMRVADQFNSPDHYETSRNQ